MHHTAGQPGTSSSIGVWAQDALSLLTGLPGVRRVGVALAEGGGRRLLFTASDRDGGSAVEWCHVDAYDDVPLTTAVRTGEPVFGVLDELDARYAPFVGRQRTTATVALAAVPITTAGQTLGGFVLFFAQPQEFGAEQRRTLARTGVELGAGLRRAQRGDERPSVAPYEPPVPLGAKLAVHDVPPEAGGVAGARRFLRATLGEWGLDQDATELAVLCASELVTNAVMHAHAGCSVRVMLDRGVLTTTVHDSGTAVVHDPGTAAAAAIEPLADPLQVHGRGLQLVDSLASRWGSELDSVGTTVWFVLDL